MPDEDDVTTLEEELEKLPNRARQHMRLTEKELKTAKAEAEEGRQAKRELAAMKAGIDLSTPVGTLFAKAYDGEWEPDALKSAWAKLGVSASSSGQQQDDGASDAEKAQRAAERQAAMEGQQHLGETKFGDWKPEGQSAQQRVVQDLHEARSKVTATDYVGALEQGKAAVRDVLHAHGMIMADEVD
jgi:hypothetical protein